MSSTAPSAARLTSGVDDVKSEEPTPTAAAEAAHERGPPRSPGQRGQSRGAVRNRRQATIRLITIAENVQASHKAQNDWFVVFFPKFLELIYHIRIHIIRFI